jgi:phosphatidylglycerol:prolipoprotein diacylglycerol transferase
VHTPLFSVFGQPVPSYFAMLITGFALATWLAARWAKRGRHDHEVMIDLGLFSLIAGVAGARVLHVLADGYLHDYVHLCTDPSLVAWRVDREECRAIEGVWDAAAGVCRPAHGAYTLDGCLAWAAFWRGGLTYYGGLIAAAAYGIHFLRREHFPVLKGMDGAAMGISLGLFFGRMGCFLGGCCFGLPTDGPLGLSFPAWSPASDAQFRAQQLASAGLPSLPVHPTQLYEALGCLALTATLMLALHPRKRFDGQVFCAFLAGYSVLRFALEYLRADDRGALFGLSTSQLISVAVIAVTGVLYVRLARHARERVASPPSTTPPSAAPGTPAPA